MPRVCFEAAADIRVARAPDRVWEWLDRLPEPLRSVPVMREVRELEPGERYVLVLGPFGPGRFARTVECDMRVRRRACEEVVLESVPGTGDADVRMALALVALGERGTRLEARLAVTPHAELPRAVAAGPVARVTRAGVAAALREGLRRIRRDLEREI